MKKALIALIATLLTGWIGMAVGNDLLNGFPEFGSIVAIAVMGAFIIGFNQQK